MKDLEVEAEKLLSEINALIPMDASLNDTVESANEKLIKDNKATIQIAILCVEKQIETLKEFYDHAFDEAMPDKNRFLAEKQQLLTILKNKL